MTTAAQRRADELMGDIILMSDWELVAVPGIVWRRMMVIVAAGLDFHQNSIPFRYRLKKVHQSFGLEMNEGAKAFTGTT